MKNPSTENKRERRTFKAAHGKRPAPVSRRLRVRQLEVRLLTAFQFALQKNHAGKVPMHTRIFDMRGAGGPGYDHVFKPGVDWEKARTYEAALEVSLVDFLGRDPNEWESAAIMHRLNPAIHFLETLAEKGGPIACKELTMLVVRLVLVLNRIARDHPDWLVATTRKLPHWPILDSPQASHRFPKNSHKKKTKALAPTALLYSSLQLGAEYWLPITKESRVRLDDELGILVYKYFFLADQLRQVATIEKDLLGLDQDYLQQGGELSAFSGLADDDLDLKGATADDQKVLERHYTEVRNATPKRFLNFASSIPKAIAKVYGVRGWLLRLARLSCSRLPVFSNNSRKQWATCAILLLLCDYPFETDLIKAYGHLACDSSHPYAAGGLLADLEERINNLPLNPRPGGPIS